MGPEAVAQLDRHSGRELARIEHDNPTLAHERLVE